VSSPKGDENMFTTKCNLKGKHGVEELDHEGKYTLIANRVLYDRGRAKKFAVINTVKEGVENVYRDPNQARTAIHSLNRSS
jgi:hypothetical protein